MTYDSDKYRRYYEANKERILAKRRERAAAIADYHRRWYTEHRLERIGQVAERKRTVYAGTCINCGGPTVGQSKKYAPQYCGKPECRSAQRKPK